MGGKTAVAHPSLRVKVLAGFASVTVLAAGVAGYKLTHKGPPSFRRGGQFAIAGPPDSPTSSTAATETSATTTAATQPATTGSTLAPSTTATTRKAAAS